VCIGKGPYFYGSPALDVKGAMIRATLPAATLAMAILMVAGCGQEGAGQGSGHESTAEPKPTPQAKHGQPEKPQTGKGEVAKKPFQEQKQHKHKQKPKSKPEPEPAPSNIPGLTPQDVYLNLENRGFECSEPELMGPEDEVRWTCQKQEAEGEYLVEISSKDANSVRLLKAKVVSNDPARADALAGDFLGYVARVPYEGAQPEKAKGWVENNVGSKASAEFGGVSYTLGAKVGSRFLEIEKLEG
jgi:outer membrane biosynthesis protein TonB